MIVQSFCHNRTGLSDYVAFFNAVGLPELEPGRMSDRFAVGQLSMRVGWAEDRMIEANLVK
jgi:hypothetical protein